MCGFWLSGRVGNFSGYGWFHCDILCFTDAAASDVDETHRKEAICSSPPAVWMNFRLDIDAVLNAMLPASASAL